MHELLVRLSHLRWEHPAAVGVAVGVPEFLPPFLHKLAMAEKRERLARARRARRHAHRVT
jgi:hypothetical protein